MRFQLTIYIILLTLACGAQDIDTLEKCDWTPVFENDLPKKFLYFKYEGPFQYSINSTSDLEEIGDGSAEVTGNHTATARLKFPILNKKRAILTGGLRYSNEQFYFEDIEPDDYPMYVGLNDRNLRSLGLDFKGMFHLKGNKSIIMQTAWNLAGDFHLSGEKYFRINDLLKSSLALGYAVRKDANTYYAFGAYFGYTFGDPSLYPVFNFSKRFSNNMGIDLLLPQGIKVWKKFSPNFYVLGAAEISGTSYTVRVNESILSEAESVQLRQSTIDATVGVLAKINKWAGIEARFGYHKNINFNVTESNFVEGSMLPKPDTDYLIKSNASGAPYFSASLFLAVPKNLLRRFVE